MGDTGKDIAYATDTEKMHNSVQMPTIPKFIDLPFQPHNPSYASWGLWGLSDQLGCLNHLTPERIVNASREIKTGISIGLNWQMDQMRIPPVFRKKLEHEIFSIDENVNDDRLSFNTQTSSQWDGFRHWAFDDGRFYNGVTQDEIRNTSSSRNGIHEWTKKGIVGRGVLIDWYGYMQSHELDCDPWSFHSISVSIVKQIAEENGVEFQFGDILLLRTGFLGRYENASEEELKAFTAQPELQYPGLEPSEASLEWLWDSHFAAVAADNPSFEAWTPREKETESHAPQRMHGPLLSGFGLPIGELFDLEVLAAECRKQSRWSFFITSEPLNVVGGVASPPNALAIM